MNVYINRDKNMGLDKNMAENQIFNPDGINLLTENYLDVTESWEKTEGNKGESGVQFIEVNP